MTLTRELVFNIGKDAWTGGEFNDSGSIRERILDQVQEIFSLMNKVHNTNYSIRNYLNYKQTDDIVRSVASKLPAIKVVPCIVNIVVGFEETHYGKVINSSVTISSDPISLN